MDINLPTYSRDELLSFQRISLKERAKRREAVVAVVHQIYNGVIKAASNNTSTVYFKSYDKSAFDNGTEAMRDDVLTEAVLELEKLFPDCLVVYRITNEYTHTTHQRGIAVEW
jgi:hypothetical protein